MLDTKLRTTAPSEVVRDRRPSIVFFAMLGVAAVAWSLLPWTWSLVDDPNFRASLLAAQDESGWWGGIWDRVVQTYQADEVAGQFRPFLYVYAGLFYLVDASAAHGLRLLMFFAALLGPAVWLARVHGRNVVLGIWATFLVLSIPGFYEGLGFLSVMELPGMLFAGLGFVDRSDRRKAAWLLLASCCKSPFVALPLAYALVLLFRRRWQLAVVTGALASGVLVMSALWGLSGTYTEQRYALTMANVTATINGVAHQAWLPAIVVLLGVVFISPAAVRLSEQSVTFGLGSLGYLAFMLPWGSQSGYNLAPPVYLGACTAVALAGTAVARRGMTASRSMVLAALVLAAIPAAHVVKLGLDGVFNRDRTVRESVAWLAELPDETRVATNGIESPTRLASILYLDGFPGWTPERLFFAPPGTPLSCRADYLIELTDQGPAVVPDLGRLIRSMPMGRIYEVAQCPAAVP